MANIPPGFKVVERPRVQFDFEPGTPQAVIDATRAYAENDPALPAAPEQAPTAAGAAVPEGFRLLGPGIGKSVRDPLQEAHEQDAMNREALAERPPGLVESFATGNAYGATGAAIGTAQLGAHVSLPAQAVNAGMEALGLPGPVDQIDATAATFGQRRAEDPAMRTSAGHMGEFTGGLIATAPISAATVPAKGASVLNWLGRGAFGGAMQAGTQPVTGGEFAPQKLEQMESGAALGAAVPAALRGGMSAAERTFGPNIMATLANMTNSRANATPFAREGEDLAERTGVRMTPGQVSGGKTQTALENWSRQSIFSADKAFEADQRIAGDAIRHLDRIMDSVSRNPASEAMIGTQLQTAARGAVVRIAAQREAIATQQYGAIDRMLNGKAFVRPSNAIKEAEAIIREYGSVATPEAERVVAQATRLREQLSRKEAYTFTEAQKNRGYYGRGARGDANVFDDVNRDINRKVATRLFKAFDADIEQSANGLSGKGPGLVPAGSVGLADAIKAANGNYRRYSELIEFTKNHPIARLFGNEMKLGDVARFNTIPPERVIARLGQMKPTELQMVRDYMDVNAPEAWQQYKRLLIEKAVDEARTLPTSAGGNVVPFNASRFVRALGGDKPERIKQLNAVFSADELSQLDDAFKVARRLGDNFGRNSSGTGPYMEARQFWDSLKSLSAKGIASSAGEVLGLRKVANVMLNADGRRALMQLSRLPPGSRQAASLLGVIAGLAAGQKTPGADDQRHTNAR